WRILENRSLREVWERVSLTAVSRNIERAGLEDLAVRVTQRCARGRLRIRLNEREAAKSPRRHQVIRCSRAERMHEVAGERLSIEGLRLTAARVGDCIAWRPVQVRAVALGQLRVIRLLV